MNEFEKNQMQLAIIEHGSRLQHRRAIENTLTNILISLLAIGAYMAEWHALSAGMAAYVVFSLVG